MPASFNLHETRTLDAAKWGADLGGATGAMAVSAPSGPACDELCETLTSLAPHYRTVADWPEKSLAICADAGVFRWFLPKSCGGFGWDEADQVRGYLRLAAADLTTTFVITQFIGACKRLASSQNQLPAQRFLLDLLNGKQFATVGISHLTTSSQHFAKPALSAKQSDSGFVLEGMSPWVTGASAADVIVLAATLDDGRELLAAVPTSSEGVTCGPGTELVALSASRTDRVTLHHTNVPFDMVLAGPIHGVMKSGTGAGTGGLQTSTLAAGLATAAVKYLIDESKKRPDLIVVAEQLHEQTAALCQDLIEAASGASCDAGELRGRANRLVMRTTQAAMSAAKGAGYVATHPVGRWCREALFFLVWSCPQPVTQEHLCELAGIE
jgi:alkylation response protein AidB-like acyl-CoA dehydrogenase